MHVMHPYPVRCKPSCSRYGVSLAMSVRCTSWLHSDLGMTRFFLVMERPVISICADTDQA